MQDSIENIVPTAAQFLEKGEKRYSFSYTLSKSDYHAFNEFLILKTGHLLKSKSRMKWLGIGEMIAGVGVLIAMLLLNRLDGIFFFLAAILLLGGALMLSYYPLIFPKQFAKNTEQSYQDSGFAGKLMSVDFYDDGLVETTEAPIGAFWEDVRGIYETETLVLFVMDEWQAVVVPKSAIEDPKEFVVFCRKSNTRDVENSEAE